MEVSNNGVSVFHRFQASFAYNTEGDLLYCNGPKKEFLQTHWKLLKSQVSHRDITSQSQDLSPINLDEPFASLRLYQSVHARNGQFYGIILQQEENGAAVNMEFEKFFAHLILDQIDFCLRDSAALPQAPTPWLAETEDIVSLFDTYLRYQGTDDKWEVCGREVFASRVQHFTSQRAKIEFCLPAFPCKSTNTNKVAGKSPDRGEELALERLHSFVKAVEDIYQPGAKLWIISDGHVFSDCIGVDDIDVDSYGEELKAMNHEIGLRRGHTDRVDFRSLIDLFELSEIKSKGLMAQTASRLMIPSINHHVNTKVTEEAEVCRQILMAGCQPLESSARERIKSQDQSLLALYRGFSRFMLEDLEMHPFTEDMSKSQRKKLSTKVAFEMIMRNQAYSNLVEILFPNHVRLSIHAHNNAGPKFGIQLFDPSAVRAVENLSPEGIPMTSRDLLHIPTPWHNCVVEMEGNGFLLVTKAKVPRQAIASGVMDGDLIKEGGAHFILRRPRRDIPTESVDRECKAGSNVMPLIRRSSSAVTSKMASPSKIYQHATQAFASVSILISIGFLVFYRYNF